MRTNKSKLKYCAKHGYNACLIKDEAVGFHPGWLKIKHLIEQMKLNPDWILWIDADAFITNNDINLESFLEGDLVIAEDSSNGVNSGVFLIRCCDKTKNFLQEVYKHRFDNNDTLAEQDSIRVYLHTLNYKIVPQRTLNSYLDVYGHNLPDEVWHKGDFVLHLPGMSMGRRILEVINHEING